MAPGKVLVLSGTTEYGKTVTIFHDATYSKDVASFAVSPYATAIKSGSNGNFYVSVGGPAPNDKGPSETLGAIDEWNVDGQLLSTIKFPGAVVAIAKPDRRTIYALMSTPRYPIAVGVGLADGKAIYAQPLPGVEPSLDRCVLRGKGYLVVSRADTHRVQLVDTDSHAVVDTPLVATAPRCIADNATLAGLDSGPLGVNVAFVKLLSSDRTLREIVAPSDTIEIEPSGDGRIYLLRQFEDDSTIQFWTRSELEVAAR